MSGVLFQRLALFVYFVGTAGFMVHIIRQNKTAGRLANWVMAAGFVLQTLALVLRTAGLGQLPVLNLADAFGFFGWAMVGAYLILYWRFRLTILGVFAAPLALILVGLGSYSTGGPLQVGPLFHSLWLTFHLGAVFAGYAFFGLAFVAGVMYLMQERQIKSKHPGPVFRRLPSLNVLDNLNYYCLTLGFPLMTLGLILGMVYAQATLGTYWRWDPKEVWSLVLWLFYAVLLHQRLTVGWRGRRAAIMAIIGFLVLCFTFVGVNMILPGYHSFDSLRQLQIK